MAHIPDIQVTAVDSILQVIEFHKAFGHPTPDAPTMPPLQRKMLRIELIREELAELTHAIQKEDLVEIADALCDLRYVCDGAAIEFGIAAKFPALFDEVHRSNMSKACKDLAEAQATAKSETEQTQIHQSSTGGYIIRRLDGKVIKSINYSPAKLEPILYEKP